MLKNAKYTENFYPLNLISMLKLKISLSKGYFSIEFLKISIEMFVEVGKTHFHYALNF